MKHIKIFEEYSDEELKDLMGDLKSVGLSSYPVLGEDYGFTSKLLKEIPDPKGEFNLYFTPETVEYMVKSGIAEYNKYRSDPKESVRFLQKNKWDSSYGSYGPGNFRMIQSLYRITYSGGRTFYILAGQSGDYGFGTSITKKVGKKARLHCQRQFLDKFKKFIDETH